MIQNSKANVEKRLAEIEVAEEINPGIEATVNRLVKIDKKDPGLPDLEAYMQWVLKTLEAGEERSVEDTERESVVRFYRRGHGAGGQNVNKRETSVRVEHIPTGMRLEESKAREQKANRKEAIKRMNELVEEHIENWMEVVTGSASEGLRKDLVTKLREVVGDRFELGQSDSHRYKSVAMERIYGVIGRE